MKDGCWSLTVLRVPTVAQLVDEVVSRWGQPVKVLCDRFRVKELEDAWPGVEIEERVTRWSEAAEDIRALRKLAKDGPLTCVVEARPLIAESLGAAVVKSDDQGNVRLVKRGSNGEARDDVAAALTLAAGAWDRENRKPPPTMRSRGVIRR